MAMLVALLPDPAGRFALGAETARRLAALGVTHVTLVRDEQATGVVIEGWAFDPGESGTAAIAAVAGDGGPARALRPLAQLTIDGGGRR